MANHEHEDRPEEAAEPEPEGMPAEGGGEGAGGPPEDISTKALSDALRVSFRFLKFAMLFLIVLYLARGIFYIEAGQVRIKLRFGRPVQVNLGGGRGRGYVMDSESGWHIRWPWEEVVTIPTGEQTLELGDEFWYGSLEPRTELEKQIRKELSDSSARPGQIQPGTGLNVRLDKYLVTGDVNIVHLKLRVRYRVRADEKGAMDFAFAHASWDPVRGEYVSSSQDLLERIVVASVIETAGSWSVMDVMKERKEDLLQGIQQRVDQALADFEQRNRESAGIVVTAIEYINEPVMPEDVRDAYYEAQEADSEKSRLIDEAKTEQDRILAQAKGAAREVIEEANAYSTRLVKVAEADAKALQKLRERYGESPQVARILRHWFYYRMVKDLLGQGGVTFVVHKPGELRILLSPPMTRLKGAEEEQTQAR